MAANQTTDQNDDHGVTIERTPLGNVALTGHIEGKRRTYYCSSAIFAIIDKPDFWFTVDDMFVRLHNLSKRDRDGR